MNLASRLESHGMPGRTLLSETTANLLGEVYELSEPLTVELRARTNPSAIPPRAGDGRATQSGSSIRFLNRES